MKRSVLFTIIGVVGVLALTGGTETTSGKIYFQNEQYEDGVTILKVALEKDSEDWEAHFYIACCYSNLDSVGLAYDHFRRAIELNPKKATRDADNNIQSNYARHYKLGQSAFSKSDYVGSAREFGIASLADPTQSAAHFNRAVAFSRLAETDSTYSQKTLEEADLALESSSPDDPNYPKALALVGRELVNLGREDEAPGRFQGLIDDSPSNFPILEEIGIDALNRQQWRGATIFLTLTCEARAAAGQENFEIYYNTGVAYYSLGRELRDTNAAAADSCFDEAIVYYEKALYMRPDEQQTILNIVATSVVKEDWSGASLWGEKYVSINPTDQRGWQFLYKIYTELEAPAKATDARNRYEALRTQSKE
jgi:tetratricopeptide (TPR) repeat protein